MSYQIGGGSSKASMASGVTGATGILGFG